MRSRPVAVPDAVCVKCRHVKIEPPGIVWYSFLCGHPANDRPLTVDPVTGKRGYAGSNDLGGSYVADDKHRNCREVNDGTCPHFEEIR